MGSKDRARHEPKKPKKTAKKPVAAPSPTISLTEHRGHPPASGKGSESGS